MADLYLTRKQLLLVRLETTENVDATPNHTESGDALKLIDPWTLDIGQEFHEITGNINRSDDAPILGIREAGINFRTYLNGIDALQYTALRKPPVHAALQACGLHEVLETTWETGTAYTYIPTVDISSDKSVTVVAHIDGYEHRITGCKGNVNFIFGANAPVIAEFTLNGRLTTQATTARAVPSGLTTVVPPKWIGPASTVIDSVSCLNMESFNLNTNNTVEIERNVASTSDTGLRRVMITHRSPGGSMDPSAIDPGTHDVFDNFKLGTAARITLSVGSDVGNVVTLAISNAIYKSAGWDDKTGVGIWDVTYQAYQSTAAAGDENFKLSFQETASFKPTDIVSLGLWLDAGQITGLADGAAVNTWADVSGLNRHASQATAASRPTYQTNEANTRPVVRFDGVNDILVNTPHVAISSAQPNTLFIVWKVDSVNGLDHVFDGGKNEISGLGRNTIYQHVDSHKLHSGGGIITSSADFGAGVFNISTGVFDGTSCGLWRNGAVDAAGDAGSASLIDGYIVGNWKVGGSGPLHGDVAQLLYYSGRLNDTDKKSVERYLANQYNIVLT